MSDISDVLQARQDLTQTAIAIKVVKLQNESQAQVLDLLQQVLGATQPAVEPGKGQQFDAVA